MFVSADGVGDRSKGVDQWDAKKGHGAEGVMPIFDILDIDVGNAEYSGTLT